MSGFDAGSDPFAKRCFLQERRFLRTVSRCAREALNADADVSSDDEFWCVAEPIEYDLDVEKATTLAMVSQLSGAEAEALARALRCLGAASAAEIVRDLRIAYAACVREHHAAGRSGVGEDLLFELALQLVDPLRSLTNQVAMFATTKILIELLAYVGLEVDEWQAVLWVRVLHPSSRVGAATALRSLAADHAEWRARSKGPMSFQLEQPRHAPTTKPTQTHEDEGPKSR
jgi:hypothetical protein